MHPRIPLALLLPLAAAVAPLEASGCGPCPGGADSVSCSSSFDISAHVPRSASALQGGHVSLCQNTACASGTILGGADGGSDAYFDLTGSAPLGIVLVEDEADGYTKLTFRVGVAPAKGDAYAVTVTAPDGTVLLNVSRPVESTVETVGCPSVTCWYASLELYPASQPGLLCGATACHAGIVLEASIMTSDDTSPVTLTACRNGACGSTTAPLPATSTDGGFEPASVAAIATGFPASVAINSGPPQTYAIQVFRSDDTAALVDGDAYSLAVTQGTATLLTWTAPVTYVETYPDGQPCDAVPCRSAKVTVGP